MATLKQAKQSITGGCLCGKVRYSIEFPAGCQWPPHATTCQCTQCRKHSGSLVIHFITIPPSQLHWSPSSSSSSPSPYLSSTPSAPFKEFSSSAHGRRGFCSECGTALSFRTVDAPDKIEILTGTVDEVFLIGDRTTRVEGKALAEKGKWDEVLKEEGRDAKILGRDLCVPEGGNFFFRNAVEGVTDIRLGGKRFVEDSVPGLIIPD